MNVVKYFLIVCFAISKTNAIWNGIKIDIQLAPHTASIQIQANDQYSHICCGIIISTKYILTARECFESNQFDPFHVRVGSSQNNEGGTLHNIARIIRHPNYNRETGSANIALIELTTEIVLSENVQAAILAEASDKLGLNAQITGWGAHSAELFDDYLLRSANIQSIDSKVCYGLLKKYNGISSDMICAGLLEGRKSSCYRDLGGPMSSDGKVFGVAAWKSIPCGIYGKPNVYISVAFYRDWIKSIAGL